METSDGFTECYEYTEAHPGEWWTGSGWREANPARDTDPEADEFIDFQGTDDLPYVHTYEIVDNVQTETDDNPRHNWKQSWDTALTVSGSMNWADEDLYRDFLSDYIDLFEDCDVDCQARGSQLTAIAGLLASVYGLVCLNAIFMFIGTWRPGARICSVYCTFAVCLFQFIVLIVAGAMLFTKYNAICSRSVTETMGEGNLWTMADDFYTTISLWAISFITMFCFLCCGLCSTIREKP